MGNKQGGSSGRPNSADKAKPPLPPSMELEKKGTTVIESPTDEEPASPELPAEPIIEMDVQVELGGAKGWPPNAHVMLYHPYQGLIITGTEGGAIFVYGDGFQYMRTLPTSNNKVDINEVSHLVTFHDDKVIAVFGNNMIYVLSLPFLNVVSSLEAGWLPASMGDVSALHVDDTTLRNFAYVGTTNGDLRVLELLCPDIRICDYMVTLSDIGEKSHSMIVSDAMMCPKLEKYLAISYDGEDATVGRVVIFDLVKKKPHRVYEMSAATSICWNHSGDIIFAGTRSGEIFQLGLDKHSIIPVWNTSTQYQDEDDPADRITIIRNMKWMAPQAPREPGCLFVLIGSFGGDTASLRSVIVALIQVDSTSELKEVLSIPPLSDEEVVGFRIAPAWDSSKDVEAGDVMPTPCVLLLTEVKTDTGNFNRCLKVFRCPMNPVTMWELESSMLAEPRRAVEVLPGLHAITAISGFSPPNRSMTDIALPVAQMSRGVSTTQVLLNAPKMEERAAPDMSSVLNESDSSRRKSRRLSTRELFRGLEIMGEAAQEPWELVICSGDRSNADVLDMVILGHEDGTVIVWGVTLPPEDYAGRDGSACGNSWIPQMALKVKSYPISFLSQNLKLSYLVAGDTDGNIVFWEMKALDDDSNYAEAFRTHLPNEQINTIEILDISIFVGTKSGAVYVCNGINDTNFVLLAALSKLSGDLGAVTHMLVAPFWRPGCGSLNIVAVYISFSNGYVVIINAYTRELLGFVKNCIQTTSAMETRLGDENALPCLDYDNYGRGYFPVRFASVLTSKYAVAEQDLKLPEKEEEPEQESSPVETRVSDTRGAETMEKRNSWLASKINRVSSGPKSPTISNPVTERFPIEAPACLLQVCNTSAVVFDLTKVINPIPAGVSIAKMKDESVAAQDGISRRVYDFGDPIVAANFVTYIEDAARFWASPILSLSCIDTMSNLTQLSFSQHQLHPMCDMNLLERASIEVNLMGSVILGNGNAYLRESSDCVFSATPAGKKYVPVETLPVRLRTDCVPPHPSQLLLTGNEDGTLSLSKAEGAVSGQMKAAQKKRRSSIITMVSSAPAELDKLFARTAAQIQKAELMSKESGEEEDAFDDESIVQKHSVKASIATTQAISANVMNETRQAFEERGEKLNRVALRSQQMAEKSAEYRQNVHAHKEKLRKKAARWGLF